MIDSRCGLHCTNCTYKEPCNCGGCIETSGHPFMGNVLLQFAVRRKILFIAANVLKFLANY